jgi:hypothetical protein
VPHSVREGDVVHQRPEATMPTGEMGGGGSHRWDGRRLRPLVGWETATPTGEMGGGGANRRDRRRLRPLAGWETATPTGRNEGGEAHISTNGRRR